MGGQVPVRVAPRRLPREPHLARPRLAGGELCSARLAEVVDADNADALGVTATGDIAEGLAGADVVMGLRIQRERIAGDALEGVADYHERFGLTVNNLAHAKADALVMHPGPINRGVEINADIAYGNQSVILEQVRNGIAVRMAVMAIIAGNSNAR